MTKDINQSNINYSGTQINNQFHIENFSFPDNYIKSKLEEMFSNFSTNRTTTLKITDAYFREKNITSKYKLPIRGARITEKEKMRPGKFIAGKGYAYAELGHLLFSISSRVRKINKVSLLYSDTDKSESIDSISSLVRTLKFEKLQRTSRSGDECFKSDCELIYTSKNKLKIKNFLVCVDAGKNGFDLFVVQTIQSPVASYYTEYAITPSGKLSHYAPVCKFESKRTKIKSRVVFLDNLEKMLLPFCISSNLEVPVGTDTRLFMEFVNEFKSAYNLGIVDLDDLRRINNADTLHPS